VLHRHARGFIVALAIPGFLDAGGVQPRQNGQRRSRRPRHHDRTMARRIRLPKWC
jgi:hypothetical protein